MYSRLSNRDAWGRPKKFRSASEAGLAWHAPGDGLAFYAPLTQSGAVAETGQIITNTGVAFAHDSTLGRGTAEFDGSDNLSVANGGTIPSGNGDISLSFWLDATAFTGESWRSIFSFGATSEGSSLFELCILSSGKLGFGDGSSFVKYSSSAVAGVWKHIVLIRKTASVEFYINGELDSAESQSANSLGSTAPLCIGAPVFSSSLRENFVGKLAATRIYDRALNSSEIAILSQEFSV